MMRSIVVWMLLVGSVWAVPAVTCAEIRVGELSVRYGFGIGDDGFDQYDLALTMPLGWQKPLDSGWLLHSELEAIVSVLTWSGDTAVKPSIMPNMVLTSPGGKVDFLAGLGAGVMLGDTEFDDDHDLGGPFFFQGQVGIKYRLVDSMFVGYRYFHQSNAGIYSDNDSVNLHQIEFGWTF